MAGTHDDALLVVELSKLAALGGVAESAGKVFADDFDPETADVADPDVRKVLGYNETIATLVKNGLLDRELVYDWLWVAGIWARVGPAATRLREQTGVAYLYENFEALAAGQA